MVAGRDPPAPGPYFRGTSPYSSTHDLHEPSLDATPEGWLRQYGRPPARNRKGDKRGSGPGWCDNFVAHAYGRPRSGYATAWRISTVSTAVASSTGTPNRRLARWCYTAPRTGSVATAWFRAPQARSGPALHQNSVPVDGHVNRITMIKGQMYGRAPFRVATLRAGSRAL
jgi:hypothetical protein